MTMQPASFDTQVMDIVELRHHEVLQIVMDPNSLWEVRDVDADYKGVEYNGRCSDIHTYHQLHIGHGFSLLMAHQGYHAPQMVGVNGIGRYNLIRTDGSSYPGRGLLYHLYPIPLESDYLVVPEMVVNDDNGSHEFLDYHADVSQIKTMNDIRLLRNEAIDREYIFRRLRLGDPVSSNNINRYGTMVLLEATDKYVPRGVTSMYVIPHPDDERFQGVIFSRLDLSQMHREIDQGILEVTADGRFNWSENG